MRIKITQQKCQLTGIRIRIKTRLDRLSQWDRAAGCVSFGQKWKTGTGRQYFTHII